MIGPRRFRALGLIRHTVTYNRRALAAVCVSLPIRCQKTEARSQMLGMAGRQGGRFSCSLVSVLCPLGV